VLIKGYTFNDEIKSLYVTMPADIFMGILIVKGHTARRLYKSFGVEGLTCIERKPMTIALLTF
jgi:hypothetical protein